MNTYNPWKLVLAISIALAVVLLSFINIMDAREDGSARDRYNAYIAFAFAVLLSFGIVTTIGIYQI